MTVLVINENGLIVYPLCFECVKGLGNLFDDEMFVHRDDSQACARCARKSANDMNAERVSRPARPQAAPVDEVQMYFGIPVYNFEDDEVPG